MDGPDLQWPEESEWPLAPATFPVEGNKDTPARQYRLIRHPARERLEKAPGSSSSSTPSNGMATHTPRSSSSSTPYHAIHQSASPLGSKSFTNGLQNNYDDTSQSRSSTPQSDDSIAILFHDSKRGYSVDNFEEKFREKLGKQSMAEDRLAQREADVSGRHNLQTMSANKHRDPESAFSQTRAPVKQESKAKNAYPVEKALPLQPDGEMNGSDSDDIEFITPHQFRASANRAAARLPRPNSANHRATVDDHYRVYDAPSPMYQPQIHQAQPHHLHSHPNQPLDFGALLNRQPNPQFPTQHVQSQTPQQPPLGSFHVPGAFFESDFMGPPTNQLQNQNLPMPMPQMMHGSSYWYPYDFGPGEDDNSDFEITHSGPVNKGRSWDDMFEDLHTNGLAYMVSDPSKNKDEIEALLANIRPDEDLPSNLTQGNPEGLKVNLMNHQRTGLSWLLEQEKGSNRGGILADDMGLGKTIQALSLILSNPSEDASPEDDIDHCTCRSYGAMGEGDRRQGQTRTPTQSLCVSWRQKAQAHVHTTEPVRRGHHHLRESHQ